MSSLYSKLSVLVCFLVNFTVLHGLDLRGRVAPAQPSSDAGTETTVEVDEKLFKWVKEMGQKAQSKLDLKLMDGKDDKCENYCSCVAGELIQLLLEGNTYKKLVAGIDDKVKREHFVFSPGCSIGADYILRRNVQAEIWEWSSVPIMKDKFGTECWIRQQIQLRRVFPKALLILQTRPEK